MKARFTHASSRPADELEELFRFAYEQSGGLAGSLAVRFTDASKRRDGTTSGYSGMAGDRQQHNIQRWVQRARFAISIKIPSDDYDWWGVPHICGHAAHAGKRDAIREAHERGEPRFGRWPIHVVWDWREAVVLVAAHELYHVLGWDRGRDGAPEVACEEFAARVLAAYRDEHGLAVAATFGPDAGPDVRSGAAPRSGLTNATVKRIMGEPIHPDPQEDPVTETTSTPTTKFIVQAFNGKTWRKVRGTEGGPWNTRDRAERIAEGRERAERRPSSTEGMPHRVVEVQAATAPEEASTGASEIVDHLLGVMTLTSKGGQALKTGTWHIRDGRSENAVGTYCGLVLQEDTTGPGGISVHIVPGIDERAIQHGSRPICSNCRDIRGHRFNNGNTTTEEVSMSTTKTRPGRSRTSRSTTAAAPAAAASSPSIDEGLDQALASGIKAAVKKTEFKTAPSGSYTAVKADGKPIGYLHPVTRKGVLVHLTISAADAKQLGVKGVEAHAKGAVKAKVYVAKTEQVDAVVAAFAKAAEPEVVKA